jgi:hypothetical protein
LMSLTALDKRPLFTPHSSTMECAIAATAAMKLLLPPPPLPPLICLQYHQPCAPAPPPFHPAVESFALPCPLLAPPPLPPKPPPLLRPPQNASSGYTAFGLPPRPPQRA